MSADLSGIIQSTGVALEQQAFKTFGAAVENTANTALSSIFGLPNPNTGGTGSVTGTGTNPVTHQDGVYDTTRYAAALVRPDQVEFNPKLKFLFKVSFKFNPQMIQAAQTLGYDITKLQTNMTFMIRHVDRPKFEYEYDEVNMYNFRTKVLKTIRNREVSFTLYDDVGNNVLNFINLYRKLQQPIARRGYDTDFNFGDYGMQFDTSMSGTDTAFRGVLPGDRVNILDKMIIHQIFVERGSQTTQPSSWVKHIDFVFHNPRFTLIDIDDMDHENGAAFNLVTVTTDFDAMFMSEPAQFTQSMAPDLPTGDIPADSSGRSTNPQGGGGNPFVNILANQAGRLVKQGVSDLINKSPLGKIGGGIIAGQLSSVSGLIGQAASTTLGNLGNSVASSFSHTSTAPVVDSSVAPSQVSDLSSQSSSVQEA